MYHIEANMYLSSKEDILAQGSVTVNHCLRFQVQLRKYIDKESGKEKSFLSFPRRQTQGKWEDVVRPDQELKEKIMVAVVEAVKNETMKDLNLPDIEDVFVTPVQSRYPESGNARIVGIATIKVSGLTIKGITIKKWDEGVFCNMPQYYTGEQYKDMAYGTSKQMQEKINDAVLVQYQELVAGRTRSSPKFIKEMPMKI